MSGPNLPQAMTAYIDLKAKEIISVMNAPGMPAMAIKANLGDENNPAVPVGEGKRVGTANVAGEDCQLWQIDAASKVEKDMNAVACISHDAIPLRMEATVDGKRHVIFEVSEVVREPQDAKLFTPPADVKIMEIPKGMIPGRK